MSEIEKKIEARLTLEELAVHIGEQMPEGVGFTLFLHDFGEGGNLAYISTARREDVMEMLHEWMNKVGKQQ